MFSDLGWFVFLAGLVYLLPIIKDISMGIIQRLLSGREEVKVKFLAEEAVMPVRSSEGAMGWDLYTTMHCSIQPKQHRFLSIGIVLKIPKRNYRRFTSRSLLATQGLEVARSVMDPRRVSLRRKGSTRS